MHSTWSRCGNTGTDFASEFGVAACHEGGHFFVASLHELNAILRASQCAQDAVDAVTWVAEDAAHAPIGKSCDNEICDSRGHVCRTSMGRAQWRTSGREPPPHPAAPATRLS